MPQPSTNHLVILDSTTGASISVAGVPWFQGISTPEQYTFPLSPIPGNQTDGDDSAVLIHPLTGEAIAGVSALSPGATPSAAGNSTWVVSDDALVQTVVTAQYAPVSLVTQTDGTYAVVTITGNTAEAATITLPAEATGQRVVLSPEGQTVVAGAQWFEQTGEPTWVMNLGTGDSEWTQFPSSETIDFATVSGT